MPNDMVLIYYAGHARVVGGKRLFLATQDSGTGRGLLAATAFSVDNFLPYFEEKKVSRYVVVLDCCRAGVALNTPGTRYRGLINDTEIQNLSGQGKVFVASAREYQVAHELDSLEHGVFSYYFVDGIQTGNATDPSEKYINISDICRYVQAQLITNHSSLSQDPVMSGEDMVGELLIALNPKFTPQEELTKQKDIANHRLAELSALIGECLRINMEQASQNASVRSKAINDAIRLNAILSKALDQIATTGEVSEVLLKLVIAERLVKEGLEIYCVKCRAISKVEEFEKVTMKNGKPAVKAVCPKCGTKMFKISPRIETETKNELLLAKTANKPEIKSTGIIKMYTSIGKDGFVGFIDVDGTTKSIYFNYQEWLESGMPQVGDKVKFSYSYEKKGVRAVNVTKI
jgi:cold shock CspA family protein